MQRFFINRPLRETEIFDNEIFHQITRVLRMKKGDQIILFCGDGIEYLYELTNFSKKSVECVQQKKIEPMDREARKNITLYQSLPNKKKYLLNQLFCLLNHLYFYFSYLYVLILPQVINHTGSPFL